MILSAFTLFHVLLSLAGIGSGFVVLYGLLHSQRLDRWDYVLPDHHRGHEHNRLPLPG